MRKQIYVAAIGLMLTMFIGLVYILPTQKTFAQTTVHAPVCFIEHNPTNLELVDCYGDPNFQQIWASFGGTEFAQHSFCYRITEGQAGIQQVDRDSPACGSWSQGKSESADNPSTPSPSTPSPSTPSPSTPSTGNTTHTNNAPAPSPATPAYTKRDGGFETVDQNCSADSVNGNGSKNCDLFKGLNIIANVLAAGVAVVVVVMVIIGGIQYSTSGGDPGKVAAAKSRIFNAVLALVAFFFLYAFLQWIVPGGIFLMDPDLQQPGKPPVSKQDLFMSPSLPPQIEPNKPKSKKKLVFIVAGVVALLLIVTVIAVVSSPKKKPTTTNTAQSTGEKSFASTDMQKIVQQYLSDMNTGKYTDAYKLISISNVTQDQFVKSYAPIFASSYDISKCTIQTDNQISHSSVVVNCPHKSGGSTVLEFKFDKVQNSLVIVEVKSLREDRA